GLWGERAWGFIDGPLEGTREFFSAVDYDRYVSYAPWIHAAVSFQRFTGQRVLELGCGMGTDLAQFAKGGSRVIGVDLTPRHLRIAADRMRHERIEGPLIRADVEWLPFRDGCVDVVYSFGVLHHTPDIATALGESWRVLRPGGRIILALYNRNSLFFWYWLVCRADGLVRYGYRRHVAMIEKGASDAVPLVRV